MKTWEMIKELTENPKRKYKRVSDGRKFESCSMKISDGQLVDYYISGIAKNGSECISLNDEWELIPQEVLWQEALSAWVKGVSIIRELGGTSCTFTKNTAFAVSRNELIHGKWYIE